LHEAPIYSRKKMLVVNDSAAANWEWFAPLVGALRARSADWLEHSDRRFVIPG
jgi:hypothetical protein